MHNILLNANQAMPHGGTISVTARNIEAQAQGHPFSFTAVAGLKSPNRDTGSKESKKNISRIFDPLLSTKPTGTGLGLSTTRHRSQA